MHPSRFHAARHVLWAALVALPLLAPCAQAQAPGCAELAEAQQRYDNGRFEEAIALATGCLEGDEATEAERQRAYRLVGLSYIGQDLRDNAREAVRQLIMLVPNFEPDPVNDPPQFIEMVEEAKAARGVAEEMEAGEEMEEIEEPADEVAIVDAARRAEEERQAEEQRRRDEEARRRAEEARRDSGGGITKWLLIGGAVVGGGALAAVLLSGGGDGDGGGGIPTPPLPPGQ